MMRISYKKTDAIDAVIAWVDGNDAAWLREKSYHLQASGARSEWNSGDVRYRDWGTLPYLFRGIECFAPWIRTVHFITWGHLPSWLNTQAPKLHIVNHRDYIPKDFLPTFNSHTIELNMHRIEGLAEQFIYFNDDMFLTAATRAEDFFENGYPRDAAILNPIPMTRHIGHAEINNIGIINDHFSKNDVIRKNWRKWYTPRYGKYLLRNFLLLPWHDFVGLYEQHLQVPYLKSTFETVWEIEAEELTRTCQCKFRQNDNVNQWLMRNWQIATGNFVPRSMKVGKMFMYGENDNYQEVCQAVASQSWKLLCINDTVEIDDYEIRRKQLLDAFEQILPKKSGFEC